VNPSAAQQYRPGSCAVFRNFLLVGKGSSEPVFAIHGLYLVYVNCMSDGSGSIENHYMVTCKCTLMINIIKEKKSKHKPATRFKILQTVKDLKQE
jgi:hypothetical protein